MGSAFRHCYTTRVPSLQTAPETGSRPTFTSRADVRAVFTDSACLARLDAGGVSLLMYPATELEAGPANLWLRRHGAGSVALAPLLGPGSPSTPASACRHTSSRCRV